MKPEHAQKLEDCNCSALKEFLSHVASKYGDVCPCDFGWPSWMGTEKCKENNTIYLSDQGVSICKDCWAEALIEFEERTKK